MYVCAAEAYDRSSSDACRTFSPTFEASSNENPDVVYGTVDVEAEQGLAAAANISKAHHHGVPERCAGVLGPGRAAPADPGGRGHPGKSTEAIGEVPAGRRTTGRLRRAIAAAVGDACRSVADAAGSWGVSWPTAHAAVTEAAEAAAGEPEPIVVLGIDETRRGRPRWTFSVEAGRWVRTDAWDTGFVDLAGDQGLLGQAEGRTSACVISWLLARTPEFREAIRFVAIDPAAVYAKAVTTPGLLPNATLVVDHFHLVKLANDAVTKVRRRVIWEQHGRRGRKIDPAWANRRD